jgi:serine/threonine protein kinase
MHKPSDPTESTALRETLLTELRRRWEAGERVRVEALLNDRPELQADHALLLDLIYQEVILRESHGDQPVLAEYLQRFPHLVEQLQIQFALDGAVLDQTDGDDTREFKPAPPADQTLTGGDGQHDIPVVAGYQILGELGRGGMGVVYKAKDLQLDRLVAVKMIANGSIVEGQRRARFRGEAEAVARLQHPNIVQIHGIDEQDGRPFITLEYVDGGNLADRLKQGPLPVPEAARLIETLARAVEAAHEHDIIHRDLKPANILLTADGVPKIADFGLAKRLDAAVNLTMSGLLMGTPSYMAPEQVEGQSAAVNRLADVYGLGAILYEALTGQPPFKGTTQVETVRQVLSQEPILPSRLRPSLPRDLQTICLKCLNKEPKQRYASAVDLADDLHRYLVGEPIHARPASRLERTLRWVRRHPARAAVIVLSILSLGLLGGLVSVFALDKQQPTASPLPFQISSLIISLHRGEQAAHLGDLGITIFAARYDDDIRVQARLSEEAYCYLIAFNPDGKEQLCFPNEANAVSPRIVDLDYPSKQNHYFSLRDGAGLQAFVLIASTQRLPPYREWQARGGVLPWKSVKGDGVWRFDGRRLLLAGSERGQERSRTSPPEPLESLCNALTARAGVEAVQLLAFPVQPKQ